MQNEDRQKYFQIKRWLYLILGFPLLIAFLAVLWRPSKPTLFPPGERQVFVSTADFITLDGHHVTLADYAGKVILLNLWATWCPPCRAEMPSMEKLVQQIPAESFALVAISSEPVPEVRKFVAENKYSFHFLLDPK